MALSRWQYAKNLGKMDKMGFKGSPPLSDPKMVPNGPIWTISSIVFGCGQKPQKFANFGRRIHYDCAAVCLREHGLLKPSVLQ